MKVKEIKKLILISLVMINLVFCASTDLAKKREKDFRYQYNLGVFYLNEGNFSLAIKHLNKCLILNPNYYLAYNALGLTYSMQGNLEKAIENFKKCLELNPDFPEAHNNLGIMYHQMGFLDKAKEEYLKTLSYSDYPHKELPYYNLALLSLNSGKSDQALDYINLSLKENSRYAMAYNLKGKILESLGNLAEAIRNYEKALEIVPNEVNFMFNLGVVLYEHKEYGRAKNIFQKLNKMPLPKDLKNKVEEYLKRIE